jgi:hypothetical protein
MVGGWWFDDNGFCGWAGKKATARTTADPSTCLAAVRPNCAQDDSFVVGGCDQGDKPWLWERETKAAAKAKAGPSLRLKSAYVQDDGL